MAGSPILDVLIGLLLLYFIFSLICTGAREWIAGIFSTRSAFLEKGIVKLLDHPATAKGLFDHPLIKNLSSKNGRLRSLLTRRPERKPSYLPATTFALALIETVAPGALAKERDRALDPGKITDRDVFDELDRALKKLPDGLQRQLRAHLDEAKGKFDEFRKNVEDWFDHGMERVTGWYRRRSHLVLWAIAIVLVSSFNLDTIAMATTLWSNRTVRDALVAQAQSATQGTAAGPCVPANASKATSQTDLQQAADCIKGLEDLQLPLGWGSYARHLADLRKADSNRDAGEVLWEFLAKFAGLLLTAAALTLGAPFWFGWLTRLAGFRNSGNPPKPAAESR